MNEIKLVQTPVIEHRLREVGEKVAKRIEGLNLDNLVATTDTVKSLKELRTTLNNEFMEFETQRKFIKKEINKPYDEFDELYKEEVTERYGNAVNTLNSKISMVEIRIKKEKEDKVKLYFSELCQAEKIDFLKYENLGFEVNLSNSLKSYKEKAKVFVDRVKSDLELIQTQVHETEIMVEYKKTLNASKAIKEVSDRKELERLEDERKAQAEWNRRILEFSKINMNLDEETNTFVYNDSIYETVDSIKELSKEDFNKKIIEFDEKIKVYEKSDRTLFSTPVPSQEIRPPKKEENHTPEPLEQPKKEENLKIVRAEFEVKGTLPQLKALGEYMRKNNIEYRNI